MRHKVGIKTDHNLLNPAMKLDDGTEIKLDCSKGITVAQINNPHVPLTLSTLISQSSMLYM